jgi:hypothetical protein
MNKFRFYFILPLLSIVLFSCEKDDDPVIAPPRDPALQYPTDLEAIETYLKSHSFEVVEVDDRTDVKIDTFIVGNAQGKVSIWDNTDYPLQFKIVQNDERITNLVNGRVSDPVDYKMYYFIINEGGGASTTKYDSTFVSYRGWNLKNKQFDTSNAPVWATFPKISVNERVFITGFRQFTPLLKAAESVSVEADGSVSFNNYGVGVVFLPSGLGYANRSQPSIPAYTPLVFTVRLHGIRLRDHDQDGILSKFENGNQVEDLYTVDTDNDRIPDFLDMDDDNDNVRTIVEIKNPLTGKPFAFEEIPTCTGGTLKKHLDPSCQ